jgi:hypothetical protein
MLYTVGARLGARFMAADFGFVRSVFAERATGLRRLWKDPEALRGILDLKEVLRALLERPCALGVSPAFYFYVLVRHRFLDEGIDDPELADYVAGVLAEKVEAAPEDPLRSLASGYTRVADFIAIMQRSHGRLRFHLQVAAGDQFLALGGLYPGFIDRRARECGAPDAEFYDRFARRVYSDAADNPVAPTDAPRRLYGELAEAMPQARRSLNRLAEEYVFLGD